MCHAPLIIFDCILYLPDLDNDVDAGNKQGHIHPPYQGLEPAHGYSQTMAKLCLQLYYNQWPRSVAQVLQALLQAHVR